MLRTLADELCTLVPRTRWAPEIRSWELRGYMAPRPMLLAEAPNRMCQTCRRAYMSGMQLTSDRYPPLTIVDSQLVTQSWWAGQRSVRHTDKPQNQHKSCSLCSPMDNDSMPAHWAFLHLRRAGKAVQSVWVRIEAYPRFGLALPTALTGDRADLMLLSYLVEVASWPLTSFLLPLSVLSTERFVFSSKVISCCFDPSSSWPDVQREAGGPDTSSPRSGRCPYLS